MALIRLIVCVAGVYATFLLWAVAQERLSTPFPRSDNLGKLVGDSHVSNDRFPSPAFISACQALASCVAAGSYLSVKRWANAREDSSASKAKADANGNGHIKASTSSTSTPAVAYPRRSGLWADWCHLVGWDLLFNSQVSTTSGHRSLLSLLLRASLCQTCAGPIGFAALRRISYPMMVLGKSCKLLPVLALNVLVYKRSFARYKYLVVALVSAGIAGFVLGADAGGHGSKARTTKTTSGDGWIGLGLLAVNLLVDGLTNSTQDEAFALYPRFSGQQMMFNMSLFSLLLTLPTLILPPGVVELALGLVGQLAPRFIRETFMSSFDSTSSTTLAAAFATPAAFGQTIAFLRSHSSAVDPLIQFALLGGAGQLFIFETIQHFGSLALVTVTVTRKLVTMLLSVAVFGHRLAPAQWAAVAVVFTGIGLEAAMKRSEILAKRRRGKADGNGAATKQQPSTKKIKEL